MKTCILDLLVLFNDHTRINIEMQVRHDGNWNDRNIYYLARKLPDLSAGSNYRRLKPFHQISILDFNFPRNNSEFYQNICLVNTKTGEIYSDKLSIHVLCLPLIEKATAEDRSSGLYFWAKVFKATTWKELKCLAEDNNNKTFKKTIVTMAQLSEDEKIRQMCEAREMYEMDKQAAYDYGYETGVSKGKDEGRDEGIFLTTQLIKKLTEAGRSDELPKILDDSAYLQQLLKEFGLKAE